MVMSYEEKVLAIRNAISTPYVVPERTFLAPELRKPHDIGWVFQEDGWASQFGVPEFPAIVPALQFEEEVDLDDASRIVTAVLCTWTEPQKYMTGADPQIIDQYRINLIEGFGRLVGYPEPGEFIQTCINASRPHVGTETAYYALLPAWQHFSYVLNLASLIVDGWSIVEGTNRVDPRPIWANIVLSGRQILEIEYEQLGNYVSEAFLPKVDLWNEISSQVAYRYVASLILLGLRDEANDEMLIFERKLGGSPLYRNKLANSMKATSVGLDDFRVIYSLS